MDNERKLEDVIMQVVAAAQEHDLQPKRKSRQLTLSTHGATAIIDFAFDCIPPEIREPDNPIIGNYILVESLNVQKPYRRQRYGSDMLSQILNIADSLNLRVDLIAESSSLLKQDASALSQSNLRKWYRHNGFIDIDDQLMSRQPITHLQKNR
jgi:GNAT superfamily N-acetyltransferase